MINGIKETREAVLKMNNIMRFRDECEEYKMQKPNSANLIVVSVLK